MEQGYNEVAAIRQYCTQYVGLVGSEAAAKYLNELYQSVRLLSSRAGLAGCGKIVQLGGAIEAMLFDQLLRSKGEMPPSSIQTLVKAVDCLGQLFGSENRGLAESSDKARVLLVDDDEVCNMSNEVTLKRANCDLSVPRTGVQPSIF